MRTEYIYVVTFIIMILILAVLAKFILIQAKNKEETTLSNMDYPFGKKDLLNENEQIFFHLIKKSLPSDYHLNVHTNLSSILMPLKADSFSLTQILLAKSVTFLVYNQFFDIMCVIAIDNRLDDSHEEMRKIMQTAGYRFIVYDTKMKPTPDKVKNDILNNI